jgi:hypothetical protein
MSVCASCGLPLLDDNGLCGYHHSYPGDDWATSNRIMCDFIHRKRILPRLSLELVIRGRSDR